MNNIKKSFKIGISGSYGGLNLGDEAILECIITQLRHSIPAEITVFSRDAKDTITSHKVDRAIPVRNMSRDEIAPEIERLDLFVLGGGGILFDGDAKAYMREVMLAHEKEVPVMTYAIGAGPLRDPINQALVKENLDRAVMVTVRERSAQKVLEECGVKREVIVTADPALLMRPESLPTHAMHREGLYGKKRLIGISVREPGMAAPELNEATYHSLLANVADFMVERFNADIVFIPMERKMLDLQHSHAIIAQMLKPQRATVLKDAYTPGQILTLMQNFVFAVGMRLHFLIFAALQGIPFVALPYASKVTGFLEALGVATPPLQLINAGRVIAHIDYLWDNRVSLMTRIHHTLPQLQEQARQTNRILLDVLRKTYPDRRIKAKEETHAGA